MKPRYPIKTLKPPTRSRTENDEEDNLPSFKMLFPEERIELKPVRELHNRIFKESMQQDYRRRHLNILNRFPRTKFQLPKIDKLEPPPGIMECKTPASNKIPDNQFLDLKELGYEEYSPEPAKEKRPTINQRLNSFRYWAHSESKRRSDKSPPPIVLASPLINRSNKYLKVCRSKAFSLDHRNEPCPLEMTFFPNKPVDKIPVL